MNKKNGRNFQHTPISFSLLLMKILNRLLRDILVYKIHSFIPFLKVQLQQSYFMLFPMTFCNKQKRKVWITEITFTEQEIGKHGKEVIKFFLVLFSDKEIAAVKYIILIQP
jgi:hypothetical protein